jgi:hypothetical protein
MSNERLRKILAFASVVEIGTGLALVLDPRIVVSLLMGNKEPLDAMPLARVAGIALLGLGMACWPSLQSLARSSPAFRAMLVYNVLIAAYLAYLFMIGHLGGVLLWPAVVLHAAVALLLLLWTSRTTSSPQLTN